MTRRIRHACWMAAALAGCASAGARSPERLREQYATALRADDPKAAYALLAPEVQAEITPAEFEARWRQNTSERKAMSRDAQTVASGPTRAVLGGTTVHEGGRVLSWTRIDDRYYVVDGLPGTPATSTPGQTIRALIMAVRRTDFSTIRSLLGDELAEAVEQDWAQRVDAMEAALDRPGSIELSSDLRRAELTYEQGRVLTLEQTPQGWRVTSLE